MPNYYNSARCFAFLAALASTSVAQETATESSQPLAVGVDSRSGYIDRTGTVVIPPPFNGAQAFVVESAAVRVVGEWGGTPLMRLPVATPHDPLVPQGASEKSPVLAGVLSFVLPGVGSFYAGHTGHGLRHLLAVPVLVGGTALGLVIANQDSGEFESAEAVVLLVGGAALLVNGVWGIVTAVSDANAYNRRIAIGELEIKPAPRLLDGSRVGIEIARLRF